MNGIEKLCIGILVWCSLSPGYIAQGDDENGKGAKNRIVITSFEQSLTPTGRSIAIISGPNLIPNKRTEVSDFKVFLFLPAGQVKRLEVLRLVKDLDEVVLDFPFGPEVFSGNCLLSVAGKGRGSGDTFVVTLGEVGPQGPQGERGQRGRNGKPGATGSDGPTGLAGPAGPQGIQGEPGPQGTPGLTGSDGVPGPSGSDGAAGAIGPIGPQGIQGEPGPQGLQGLPGTDGVPGPSGLDGAAGAIGPIGPQGIQGEPGPQGSQGLPGADGVPGLSGSDGAAGAIGPIGLQGIQGELGPQGPAGPPGSMTTQTDHPNTFKTIFGGGARKDLVQIVAANSGKGLLSFGPPGTNPGGGFIGQPGGTLEKLSFHVVQDGVTIVTVDYGPPFSVPLNPWFSVPVDVNAGNVLEIEAEAFGSNSSIRYYGAALSLIGGFQ